MKVFSWKYKCDCWDRDEAVRMAKNERGVHWAHFIAPGMFSWDDGHVWGWTKVWPNGETIDDNPRMIGPFEITWDVDSYIAKWNGFNANGDLLNCDGSPERFNTWREVIDRVTIDKSYREIGMTLSSIVVYGRKYPEPVIATIRYVDEVKP
jgi:hypothetical protein